MKIKAIIYIEAPTREDIDHIIQEIETSHTWADDNRKNVSSVEIVEDE